MLMGPIMQNTFSSEAATVPTKRLPLSAPVHNYGFKDDFGTSTRYIPGKAAENRTDSPHRDIGSRFGQRLRELRQERNLTQSQMAKKFGIDRSFISDVERGRKSISLGLLEVVALGLKVSLSDLFRDL